MSIKQITPNQEIADFFETKIQMLEAALVRGFCNIGEKCVNIARNRHTYRDQTGNLTSSVGYGVSIDGHLVKNSSFNVVLNGAQGAKDGEEYLRHLISQYPSGIVLIVVAGKDYAVYVSDKGYDVTDSAESLAEQAVPDLLQQLGLR